MNDQDRKHFEQLKDDMVEVKDNIRDHTICLNSLCEDIHEINTNHLKHIEISCQKNEADNASIKAQLSLILKVIGWGLALLGIVVALTELL